MKKFLMLLISIAMIFAVSGISLADTEDYTPMLIATNESDSIKVQQDGKYVDFRDSNGNIVEPQIINGRTMVPFRKIFNSLGVSDEEINWDGETRTVTAKKDNIEIELQIDNNVAKKIISGDETQIILDQAPIIIDGRTLVPVRFIAESMEKKVGWDSDNRTVIIIDSEKLISDLENAIPKYFEMVNSQTVQLKNFDISMNIDGKVDYTEKGKSSNNSSIKLTGNLDMVKSDDTISMNFNLKFSGKGVIYDEIKNSDLTNIDLAVIMKENKLYIKSSLFGDSTNGKWVLTENEAIKELFNFIDKTYNKEVYTGLLVDEKNLNVNSYDKLKLSFELLKVMFKDDNIKVNKNNSAKEYEMTLDFLELIDFMNKYDADINTEALKSAKIKAKSIIKNGVADSSKVEFDFQIAEGNETLAMKINVDAKVKSYNKTYKIDLPSEKDVMTDK